MADLNTKQQQALEEAITHIEGYYHTGEYEVSLMADNIMLVTYSDEDEVYVVTINPKNNLKPMATLLTYIDGKDVEITINSLI